MTTFSELTSASNKNERMIELARQFPLASCKELTENFTNERTEKIALLTKDDFIYHLETYALTEEEFLLIPKMFRDELDLWIAYFKYESDPEYYNSIVAQLYYTNKELIYKLDKQFPELYKGLPYSASQDIDFAIKLCKQNIRFIQSLEPPMIKEFQKYLDTLSPEKEALTIGKQTWILPKDKYTETMRNSNGARGIMEWCSGTLVSEQLVGAAVRLILDPCDKKVNLMGFQEHLAVVNTLQMLGCEKLADDIRKIMYTHKITYDFFKLCYDKYPKDILPDKKALFNCININKDNIKEIMKNEKDETLRELIIARFIEQHSN